MNAHFANPPSPSGRRAGDEGAAQLHEKTIAAKVAEIFEA